MKKNNVIDNKNVILLDHPLIKHKITLLRDKNTNTTEFLKITKEVSEIIGIEVFRNLKTEKVLIETPLEKTLQPKLKESNLCLVPILRAGLGIVEGFSSLINDRAKLGHLGLYRDPKTHLPKEYFNKLPKNIKNMTVYLLDPMVATCESAIDAVNLLKKKKLKK